MSEFLSVQNGFVQGNPTPSTEELYVGVHHSSVESTIMDRLRNRWTTLAATAAALVAIAVAPSIEEDPAYAASPKQAVIGMPFGGRWAYNIDTTADCGPDSGQTAHPSCHPSYSFQWATDLYAPKDEPVKVYGSSAQGEVTFKKVGESDTCSSYGANIAGKGVTFDVLVGGDKVGQVKYDHIDPESIGSDPIASGTKIGKVTSEPLQDSCYQVSHTHVQFKNTEGNYSCYINHSNADHTAGQLLSEGASLGVLGSDSTNAKEACSGIPDTATSTPYPSIPNGQEFYAGEWVYTKVGDAAWPIKPKSDWTNADKMAWGGEELVGPVPIHEVHNHEAGYGSPTAHPPRDGTAVYVRGSTQQYYFIRGKAYPIGVGEVADLGVQNQAFPVPATGNRLPGFTGQPFGLANGEVYRLAGGAMVNQVIYVGGSAVSYHVNNDTVKDCLRLTQGREVIILPQAAGTSMAVTGSGTVAGCTFPPSMVVRGPGGIEQWRIEGNNPYVRRYFPNSLTVYLHTSGNPNHQTVGSAVAITNVPEGPWMDVPEGMAFVDQGNGAEFVRKLGEWHHVPYPSMNQCLGILPSQIISVPPEAVGALPQGTPMACEYDNRILVRPDGRAYWVEGGRKHLISNPAVRDCVQLIRNTGGGIAEAHAKIDTYTESSPAYCEYERDYGLKFVKEQGSQVIYFVENDGTLRHAGSVCVADWQTTQWKQFRVWEVAPGATTRPANQYGPAWFASPAACDALPRVWV